jgi:hypothetical protein
MQVPGPYYAYDLGAWHLISLTSEIPLSSGSAQLQWLQNDLAANAGRCTLAYWHRPRFLTVTAATVVTKTLLAEGDARVTESAPGTNYGPSYLRVDGGSGVHVESVLRFTVPPDAASVGRATLRVYARERHSGAEWSVHAGHSSMSRADRR